MAQTVKVTLIDDIDGTEASESIDFSLDGIAWNIDLNAEHAKSLRETLMPYISSGRRVNTRQKPTSGRQKPSAGSGVDVAAVRAWAASNNVALPARGRLPRAVVEQFQAAMDKPAKVEPVAEPKTEPKAEKEQSKPTAPKPQEKTAEKKEPVKA